MTPLHEIGTFIRELMAGIPMPVARTLFVALPVVLLVWVLRLPRERTTPENGTGGRSENLKYGAAAALLIQIAIYSVL